MDACQGGQIGGGIGIGLCLRPSLCLCLGLGFELSGLAGGLFSLAATGLPQRVDGGLALGFGRASWRTRRRGRYRGALGTGRLGDSLASVACCAAGGWGNVRALGRRRGLPGALRNLASATDAK